MTDHRPLCSLLTSDRLNSCLRRMAMKLQPWVVRITYLPGKECLMADGLSRQKWSGSLETALLLSSEVLQSDERGVRDQPLQQKSRRKMITKRWSKHKIGR